MGYFERRRYNIAFVCSITQRCQPLFLWPVLIYLFLASTGCISAKYEYGQRCRRELLTDKNDIETISHKNFKTYYPIGMQDIASQCAKQLSRQLAYVQSVTGLEPAFTKFNLYIKSVDRTSPNDVWAFLESRDTFGVVLYVEPRDESYEAIVAKNFWYPCSVMHEIAECSLIQLQNDRRWKSFGGVQKEEFHYTRWFRDGFAEYAGFLAYQMTVFDSSFSKDKYPIGTYRMDISNHPFSSLNRVGIDLFQWHQHYKDPVASRNSLSPNLPHPGNRNIDYYSAALGLFLVIEDKYGRKAIKEIMQKISKLKKGDGEAVKSVVNEILDTDIMELVSDFYFPKTGLYMNEYWTGYTPDAPPNLPIKEGLYVLLVDPNSPAQRAGIRKGDVIINLDDEYTVTNLDFELALYKRRDNESVKVGVWRKGKGNFTVEMILRP